MADRQLHKLFTYQNKPGHEAKHTGSIVNCKTSCVTGKNNHGDTKRKNSNQGLYNLDLALKEIKVTEDLSCSLLVSYLW